MIMRGHMLDYVVELRDDANGFSLDVAKASHAVLLRIMEQGKSGDCSKIEQIDRVRRANAQMYSQTNTNTMDQRITIDK